MLTAFVAILLGALVCILFFLRWVFRPYRQLVGEAEKASIEHRAPKSSLADVLPAMQCLGRLEKQLDQAG